MTLAASASALQGPQPRQKAVPCGGCFTPSAHFPPPSHCLLRSDFRMGPQSSGVPLVRAFWSAMPWHRSQ